MISGFVLPGHTQSQDLHIRERMGINVTPWHSRSLSLGVPSLKWVRTRRIRSTPKMITFKMNLLTIFKKKLTVSNH